jgi:phage/plasmid-associated DNA primase
MSDGTFQLLQDLGVPVEGMDLVWEAIVEDIQDHFVFKPRTRRRPNSDVVPDHTPIVIDHIDDDYQKYMERNFGVRPSYAFEGDELPMTVVPNQSRHRQRRRHEEVEEGNGKKKDRIPVSSLIKDEARKTKQEVNQERRKRELEQARGTPRESREEPEHKSPAKKRRGTW